MELAYTGAAVVDAEPMGALIVVILIYQGADVVTLYLNMRVHGLMA